MLISEISKCMQWESQSQPMIQIMNQKDGRFASEMNLYNPYSKVSCLLLYLYTLELSQPPLYAVLNKARRTMDTQHLMTLGPFSYGLFSVLQRAEENRNRVERIKPGIEYKEDVLDNYAGLFMLFKGAKMKPAWIEEYRRQDPLKQIKWPGNTGCSQSIKVALDDALFENQGDEGYIPVLFSICMKNYQRFTGVRLCNENYSAYPSENDTLLMEETSVFTLGVEDHLIQNTHPGFEDYYNMRMTIIYLYHAR